MNIAELFVNLGIKGADKTVGALGSVKKGLNEVGSMSIEAKAGILGAVYGLERMMAISGAMGTGLTNFAALTGLSAQGLQQWQYAARQAGVSSEELTGSLKGVQNSMSNMLMGKGAPEGIALVSKAVGGLDPTKYKDTFYIMTQLQKAMQTMSPEMGNIAGKSFGLSEGTIAAMRRNAFTPQVLSKAPTLGAGEMKSLDKSNVAWANLSAKIEMAFAHFNAKHGTQMVSDISKIVDAVLRLANSLEVLAEKAKIFKYIGMALNGVAEALEPAKDWTAKKGGMFTDPKGFAQNLLQETKEAANYLLPKPSAVVIPTAKAVAPSIAAHGPTPAPSNVTHITQTIAHHGDAKDTKAVKDTHKAAINHAYRQRSAQRQGS